MGESLERIFISKEFLGTLSILTLVYLLALAGASRVSVFNSQKVMTTAHEMVACLPNTYLAISGICLWFFDPEFAKQFHADPLHNAPASAVQLCIVMMAYQCWDFVICLASSDLRTPVNLAHHSGVIVVAIIALLADFGVSYGIFFFGFAEISSVPLGIMNIFKANKELAASWKSLNELSGACFALLFLLVRNIYWPMVTFNLFSDTVNAGVGLPLLVAVVGGGSAFLLLQFFWGWLIVRKIIAILRNPKSAQDSDSDAEEFLEVHASPGDLKEGLLA